MPKEDLQAIEDLLDRKLDGALDRKLDEKLAPIHDRLESVELTCQAVLRATRALERTSTALVTAVTDLLGCLESPLASDIKRNLERDLAPRP